MRTLLSTLLLFALCGCVSHAPPTGVAETCIQSGDCLLIRFKNDNQGIEGRVKSDGNVALPLAGTLHVAGMTMQQVTDVIKKAYYVIKTAQSPSEPITVISVSVAQCP
jgi:protein involved in polysaccharide export with SLBB domain